MKVGDVVRKKDGYLYPGVIVAVFQTTAGKTRYVVECTAQDCAGMLHIFREEQLELIVRSDLRKELHDC